MNIFADFHHAGLFNSLHLLFEKRLGYKLFRPLGMEWAEQEYWLIHKPYGYALDTAKQYLQIKPEYIPMDGTVPLNRVIKETPTHYEVEDISQHFIQKCITLEQFKSMPIDIIIASIPDHVASFKRLQQEYHPKAKFVFQMGNMFQEIINNLHEIPNLLSSTIEIPVPVTCHSVFYHQEFDTSLFENTDIPQENTITSFINLLPQTVHYGKWKALKELLPDYTCKSYGILCDDGTIHEIQDIAFNMKRSQWGFHAKWMGDGFGHVLYNWYATGRPVITCISDYKDKLGGELLTDGETCIDLDAHSVHECAEILRSIRNSERYHIMCQKSYERFKEKVDYDEEEKKIRSWIETLQ